jgi:hypothetical protein
MTIHKYIIALCRQNAELPVGQLESTRMNYTLRVSWQYQATLDFSVALAQFTKSPEAIKRNLEIRLASGDHEKI